MSHNLTSWPKQTSPKPQGPCAECRKRKLKCQRTYPCLNCQNSGRADACLQSSVVKGTRSLKPSQVVMQEDLTVMSVRKDQLEAALAELQATISSDPHPLLVTDSQIRTASPVPGLLRNNDATGHDDERDSPDAADELVEALGMMSIKHDGKSQYHGDTVTSEYLVKEGEEPDGRESADELPTKRRPPLSQLPPEIVLLSTLFPFPPKRDASADLDIFLPYLPPYDRALILLDNYFTCFCWSCMLLTPSETIEGIFGVFYPEGRTTTHLRIEDAQRLSVMFAIFVLGTLYDLDLNIQRFPAEAEEYHSLARAAAVFDPVADNPTTYGVQALVLMIWYFRLFPGRRSPSYQWGLSGIIAKLIIATGLHRDHSAVIPDPKDRVLYEQTFWECNAVDIWQSFMFGRPTSLDSSEIDCKIPHRVEVPNGQDPDFFPWKYSFAMLVSRVIAQVSSTTSYSDILKFDKMLKEHYTPASLTWPPEEVQLGGQGEALGKTFQRYIMSVWKNVSIMYIHRRLMVQTILEHKDDAIRTPFWYSVDAAYTSAAALTRDMRRLWLVYPKALERMGPFWSHGHSAALVLCALVARLPRWERSETALRLVDETCKMFVDAKESLQPSNALSSLLKHQTQAHYAFKKARSSPERGSSNSRSDSLRISISPSDTSFPFEFGESPPQMMGITENLTYNGSGVLRGRTIASPVDSEDTMPASDQLPQFGGPGAYGGVEQQANQWGQYLVDMGVHY